MKDSKIRENCACRTNHCFAVDQEEQIWSKQELEEEKQC